MSASPGALREGMRRVTGAPVALAGVWLITAIVSLPLTVAMRGSIARQLGDSLEAAAVADGASYDWMQEFTGQVGGASPLATTLRPNVIGFAAVLDNLSAFLDRKARPLAIFAAAVVYVVLWTFLAGGLIDRFARNRPTRTDAFFSACGVFFFRFLRLGICAWAVYGLLFWFVHPLMFQDVYGAWVANETHERTAFLIRVLLYAAFVMLLAGWNLIVDYAKVRAVVEDRRSALGALLAALRFVHRNPAPVFALYAANSGVFAAVLIVYALVAPGAGGAGVSMWLAFALSQAYVIARLWVKLVFWASETALFQSGLAHAGYVRRPAPQWPDSPAVDAIRN
jgi:hypothetical protein